MLARCRVWSGTKAAKHKYIPTSKIASCGLLFGNGEIKANGSHDSSLQSICMHLLVYKWFIGYWPAYKKQPSFIHIHSPHIFLCNSMTFISFHMLSVVSIATHYNLKWVPIALPAPITTINCRGEIGSGRDWVVFGAVNLTTVIW